MKTWVAVHGVDDAGIWEAARKAGWAAACTGAVPRAARPSAAAAAVASAVRSLFMVMDPPSGRSFGQSSTSVQPAPAACNDHAPTSRPEPIPPPLTCKDVKGWDAGSKGWNAEERRRRAVHMQQRPS
ncbi:hypothetical protein SGL43_07382 [Streptomyces globisporus]|uniref:Uncharacterized protein n=1 Tax=Streptomyces globisporus TaxID=1908 RepID=A0ABM9H9G5_STRGL|nr:hypothetical protein SGL43_07382 [Streptomyces globisporus]